MTRTPLIIRLAPWLFTLGFLVIWEVTVRAFKIPEFQAIVHDLRDHIVKARQ